MNLYSSRHFALTNIQKSGKKQIAGILDFKGLPSVCGAENEVLAAEHGTVIAAGRCTAPNSRIHRLGTYVTISGHDGATVTYSRLAARYVSPGEYVEIGQPIGVEGNTGAGSGNFLRLEFRRNGRLIDGCAYLGIKPELREFTLVPSSPAEIVCNICNIPLDTRRAIDRTPRSDYVWQQLLSNLRIR